MKIYQTPNIFLGLNNSLKPTNPLYKEGFAYKSTNSRIDKEGVWNKAPLITTAVSGVTERDIYGKTGTHFVPVTLNGSFYIAGKLEDSGSIVSGINKWIYYLKSGALYYSPNINIGGEDAVSYSTPENISATISTYVGTRMETGLYYYLVTQYDTFRDVESLPYTIVELYVRKNYINDVRQVDVPRISGNIDLTLGYGRSTATSIRLYRSKCIKLRKGDTLQSVQENIPTEFYFVAEGAAGSDLTWYDYAHDSEIAKPENLFTGRGSSPPTSLNYIAKFQNRLFAFKSDIAYWSSSGRPEEFPQEYDLTFQHTYTNGTWTGENLTAGGATTTTLSNYRPILDTGIKAAAKLRIPELMGETVKGAIEYEGKLWVFTEHSCGVIIPTAKSDGYKYLKVSDDIGICSPRTLQITPYGVFGADSKGIWQITDTIRRISDGVIDIDDSTKDTYLNYSSYASASFGVWVASLNEYWWSFQNSATPTYCQIVYQADTKRFVGPYSLVITGGCSFISSGGWQCYLTGGKTPTIPADRSGGGVQTLKFWLGQETYGHIKDDIEVSVYYDSITSGQTITASTYCNKTASETGAQQSSNFSHTSDDLIGIIVPNESGRFIEVNLSIPTTCTAPIAGIDYEASIVPRFENARR